MPKFFVRAVAAGLFFLLTVGAQAWPVHGTASSGFNGGKAQLGFNFLQIANDFAFLNAMKGAQGWALADNSGFPTPDTLDVDGYPTVIVNGGVYSVFYVPTQAERPGNYVVTWSGNGTIRTNMANVVLATATFTGSVSSGVLTAGTPTGGTIKKGMALSVGGIVAEQLTGATGQAGTYSLLNPVNANSQTITASGGSKTSSTGSGRYVFTTSDFRFDVGITAIGSPAVSDLKVFHVDDEAALNAGQVFGTKFKQRIAEGRFGVLRYLDWQPGNTSNVTTWSTRKRTSYVYYSGADYPPSLYGGISSNSGDDFSVAAPSAWAGLVNRAIVIVKFNATAAGNTPTLNVGGSGAKQIKNQYGDTLGTGTRPGSGRTATLIYDSVLDCWLKFGGDSDFGNGGISNGVPPELMVRLAAETGAHPYFVTPFLTIDPITDYMPSLAAYIRDNGPAWMIPRFEGPNETWNNALGFFATRYSWNKGLAYWGTSFDQNNWYGMAISLLGQAVSAVYSNDRNRYQVMVGVQTTTACGNTSCTTPGTSGSNNRLNATQFVTNGPAQAGYTQTPAYQWATHVVMANYITGTAYGTLQELIDAYSYAVTNVGNPVVRQALADSYADSVTTPAAPFNLAYVSAGANYWYAWAQNNWGGSIKLGLSFYEGGYSPDTSGINWTSPITGATAANPSVLTLATTSNPRSSSISGNPAVVGMQLSIPMTITNVTQAASAVVTVSGFNMADVGRNLVISGFGASTGMSQLNGTWAITNVSGQDITLNVDSTAFTPYVSGGTATLTTTVTAVAGNSVTTDLNGSGFTYSSGKTATYVNSATYINALRVGSKWATGLTAYTTTNLTNMVAAGGTFPSQFNMSGSTIGINRDTAPGGQIWGIWDPSIYAEPPSTAWPAFTTFNFLLKRDLNPASNDNTPMYLEIAA